MRKARATLRWSQGAVAVGGGVVLGAAPVALLVVCRGDADGADASCAFLSTGTPHEYLVATESIPNDIEHARKVNLWDLLSGATVSY